MTAIYAFAAILSITSLICYAFINATNEQAKYERLQYVTIILMSIHVGLLWVGMFLRPFLDFSTSGAKFVVVGILYLIALVLFFTGLWIVGDRESRKSSISHDSFLTQKKNRLNTFIVMFFYQSAFLLLALLIATY